MKLLTFATHRGGRMDAFLESCRRVCITPQIVGEGESYPGHMYRLKRLYPIVKALPEEEVVLFCDAFDSLVLNDATEIEARFKAFDTALLYGAETCCAPHANAAQFYPDSPFPPYKYLNAGGYIGYAGFIRQLWDRLKIFSLPDEMNDQGAIVDYFLTDDTGIALDYGQEVICNLYGAEHLVEVRKVKGHPFLVNTRTGSLPCVAHGSGGADMSAVYRGFGL